MVSEAENLIIYVKNSSGYNRCQILKDAKKAEQTVWHLNYKAAMAKVHFNKIVESANNIIDQITDTDVPSDYMTRIVGMVTMVDNPVEQSHKYAITNVLNKLFPNSDDPFKVLGELAVLAESRFGYMTTAEFNKISS